MLKLRDRAGTRSAVRTLCAALAVGTCLSVAVMLGARETGHGQWARIFTICASTGFVLVAVAGGGLASWFGRWVLLALVCCWFGDILGPINFFTGLLAFLLGHLVFITAFWTKGISAVRCLAAAAPVLACTGLVVWWLFPHVPATDRTAVAAYVAVLTGMLLTAAGASRGPAGRILLAAAVVFYVSDVFVARWRYVDPIAINAFFCYPLYYAACTMFAFSVCIHDPFEARRD